MKENLKTVVVALLVSGVALVVDIPTSHAGRDEARSLYKKGLHAYRAGNMGGAMELFRHSEDADPTYAYPTFALGQIYQKSFEQKMDHYEDAVQTYERLALLLRNAPPSKREKALYQVYYFEGLLYLKGGEYDRALRSLETFLRIQPDFTDLEYVHNAIGIALYYLDQYDQAVEAFRRAIAVEPDYAEARFNLRSVFTRLSVYNEAVAVARAGEPELAMEKVGRLKEFAPRYLPGRRLEGKLLKTLGRPNEALRVYREILGIDPNDALTYSVRVEMAKILRGRDEKSAALNLLRENLRRFPAVADGRAKAELLELMASLGEEP